jgi:hypothetical protein
VILKAGRGSSRLGAASGSSPAYTMSVVYPTLNSKAIDYFPKTQHGAAAGVFLFLTELRCFGLQPPLGHGRDLPDLRTIALFSLYLLCKYTQLDYFPPWTGASNTMERRSYGTT